MRTTKFVHDHIDQMNQIETSIILYLNDDEEYDQKSFLKFLNEQKIETNKYKLKEFLHLISKISKYHHRTPKFFDKIEAIIKFYLNEIKNSFTNFDIFNIFKGNKRVLLFLFEEKIVFLDDSIHSIIFNDKYSKRSYPQYFSLEFNTNDPNLKDEMNNIELFKQKRKIGTNDGYLCRLIQQDLVEDFISHVNHKQLSLSSKINKSIYETNTFLLDKTPTLIEYAAFYGSIQIFQYLFMNQVELTPSLWFYSVHSNNPQLIHFLEENKVPLYSEYENDYFDDILNESIKCHHNEFVNYIRNNFNLRISSQCDYSPSLRYYNFNDINSRNFILKSNNLIQFFELIKYDYIVFIENILPTIRLNLNESKSFRIPNPKDNSFYTIKIRNALQLAVENKKTEIVELLLKHPKVNINSKSVDDKYFTGQINSIERIEMSPLLIAINDGNIDMFKLLISNSKIDISKNKVVANDYDKKLKLKIPLLTFAVAKKRYNIVQYLLTKSDIDINEKTETINEPTKYGETCIKISRNQSLTICNLSLQRTSFNNDVKMNEDKKSNYIEKTALHIAIESENLEMINLLLSKPEINVNAKSIEKRESNYIEKTALHIAIEKENLKIINSLLLNAKIDINAKSIEIINSVFVEKTAMQIAVEKRNSEIIILLMNHAKTNEYLNTEIKATKENTSFNTTTDNNNQNIISLFKKDKN